MYTPSPKRSLDTRRTDSRPGPRFATFLLSARIVKVLSAIEYVSSQLAHGRGRGLTYSMRPVRRTLQSSHQDICIVHSVIFIRSNSKYELYNSVCGIGVCIEIYSNAPMSNLLAAIHCLPTEPIHKPVADKGFFQRYLRIQSRSMQHEKHEGELDRGHAVASERIEKRGECKE